jgi:aminopeptidase N
MAAALTVTEARTRASSVAVSSYRIELDLTRGDTVFGSRTVVEFDSLDGRQTWVDVQPEQLVAVHLNEQRLDVGALRDGRYQLTDLEAHNVLVVDAVMAYSHDGEGLHRAVDPQDGLAYVYAMTFLPAAPRVFACFDQPDLKAPYGVTVTAPPDWTVLGNTVAAQREPGVWDLATTSPLSTYVVTLVAGPYHSVVRAHDGIALGLHCRQSLAPHLDKDADEIFTVTGQCFDEYHRLFGIRYPFGDYHQVFAPEFNAGAMENPGCVVFSDDYVFKSQATDSRRAMRAYIVAHEMAHQWFGDLVTMRWWDDLWLNESFATYMGYRVTAEVTQFRDIWVQFSYHEKAWGLTADQRRSTHPVAGNGARDTEQALTDFDGISYSKGAAVLRQLNMYLGDAAFVAGVVDHLRTHAFGNATLDDLLGSWDRVSDKDVRAWAGVWLRTVGVDSLAAVAADGGVEVLRTSATSPDASRPHAFTLGWYAEDSRVTSVPVVATGERTPVELAGYDGSGLLLPDTGDQAWAKVRLADASVPRVVHHLGAIEDPLARAVVWAALREGMYDALVSPDDYLTTMEQALDGESDLAVEAILGPGLGGAIGHLGTYFARPRDRERLSALAVGILLSARPASNRQVVAGRAAIALSADDEMLSRWLHGDAPDGYLVDEDVRWRIIRSLCERGVLGRADIDAERARDRSSQGADHALRCRASLPDPDVKAQVWHAITTDASLTNNALYALCECFFRPGQENLLQPYVERFFTDIPATATFRAGMMVELSAGMIFPRFAVSEHTVRLCDERLAGDGLVAGTRRAISDRTDDMRRVLDSRRAFPVTADDDR